MIRVLRLTLVSHAMTDAMAAGRFPDDEPINSVGRHQLLALSRDFVPRDPAQRQLAGPELRARQSAQALGLHADTESRLADLNYGLWRGKALTGISGDDMHAWMTDPGAAPHGGESILDLIKRVSSWLYSLEADTSATVAVTHPAVIRAAVLAALDADPQSFWRIDVAPAGSTVMHRRGGRWTLRL